MKTREARHKVRFPVRIKLGEQWTDACIGNASSRGIMLQMDHPPARGSFIEIRRANMVIVGQVRWTQPGRCGIRTQDRVPIDYLRDGNPLADAPRAGDNGMVERRASVRTLTPAEIAERSRIKAILFQNVTFAAIAIGGAGLIALFAYDVLGRPFAIIKAYLG